MLKNLWVSKKKQSMGFIGDRTRGIVSQLFPYSNYKLEMVVVNGRGDGPRSEILEFTTPEGGRFLPDIYTALQNPSFSCVKHEDKKEFLLTQFGGISNKSCRVYCRPTIQKL